MTQLRAWSLLARHNSILAIVIYLYLCGKKKNMSHYHSISTELLVVYDNRMTPQRGFHTDMSINAYQHLLINMLSKLLYASSIHPQISEFHTLAVPSSPTTMRLHHRKDFSNLKKLLCPQHSVTSGSTSANCTWANLFVHVLQQWQLELKHDEVDERLCSPKKQHWAVLFSSDLNMLGVDSGSVESGLSSFAKACVELKMVVPLLHLRFFCVQMRENGSSTENADSNSSSKNLDIIRNVLCKYDWIQLECVQPSTMIFDDIMRSLLGALCPTICTSIVLPSWGGLQCDIKIQLRAHSTRCLECLGYMKALEVCATVARDGIDAMYIAGYGLQVCIPEFTWEGFNSQQSITHNTLLFQELSLWLSSRGMVLVLRVPYSLGRNFNETTCSKYWALVPQPAESILGCFSLIMLIDRDECIIPFPDCLSSILNPIPENPVRQHIKSFFDSSLGNTLGSTEAYNPWAFIGGQFTAQFEASTFALSPRKPFTIPDTKPKTSNSRSKNQQPKNSVRVETDPTIELRTETQFGVIIQNRPKDSATSASAFVHDSSVPAVAVQTTKSKLKRKFGANLELPPWDDIG